MTFKIGRPIFVAGARGTVLAKMAQSIYLNARMLIELGKRADAGEAF